MLGSQRAELQLCRCAAQVSGYLSQVSWWGHTRDGHSCGSRQGEGNKRAAEANGNERATKTLAWQGLSYRHDFLSPRKGSKQTKEAVPGLLKSDKKLPAGDKKSRRKPGAAASHTMSPVVACFYHRRESAPVNDKNHVLRITR